MIYSVNVNKFAGKLHFLRSDSPKQEATSKKLEQQRYHWDTYKE